MFFSGDFRFYQENVGWLTLASRFLSRKCWLAHSRKSVFIKNMLVGSLSQLSPYRVAARRRILRRLENMQRHSLEGGWMDYQNECLSVDTFCCL